ncbi:MAG: hypothetical protein AB7U73_05275 [Pirellulales bacterium]
MPKAAQANQVTTDGTFTMEARRLLIWCEWSALGLFMASLPALVVAFFERTPLWQSLGCICLASGLSHLCLRSIRRREIRTNWGTISSEQSPLRFWIEMLIWGGAAVAVALLGVLVAGGKLAFTD